MLKKIQNLYKWEKNVKKYKKMIKTPKKTKTKNLTKIETKT